MPPARRFDTSVLHGDQRRVCPPAETGFHSVAGAFVSIPDANQSESEVTIDGKFVTEYAIILPEIS
jgi:hypothetical protein